jgi:hypothetical protein
MMAQTLETLICCDKILTRCAHGFFKDLDSWNSCLLCSDSDKMCSRFFQRPGLTPDLTYRRRDEFRKPIYPDDCILLKLLFALLGFWLDVPCSYDRPNSLLRNDGNWWLMNILSVFPRIWYLMKISTFYDILDFPLPLKDGWIEILDLSPILNNLIHSLLIFLTLWWWWSERIPAYLNTKRTHTGLSGLEH